MKQSEIILRRIIGIPKLIFLIVLIVGYLIIILIINNIGARFVRWGLGFVFIPAGGINYAVAVPLLIIGLVIIAAGLISSIMNLVLIIRAAYYKYYDFDRPYNWIEIILPIVYLEDQIKTCFYLKSNRYNIIKKQKYL